MPAVLFVKDAFAVLPPPDCRRDCAVRLRLAFFYVVPSRIGQTRIQPRPTFGSLSPKSLLSLAGSL